MNNKTYTFVDCRGEATQGLSVQEAAEMALKTEYADWEITQDDNGDYSLFVRSHADRVLKGTAFVSFAKDPAKAEVEIWESVINFQPTYGEAWGDNSIMTDKDYLESLENVD